MKIPQLLGAFLALFTAFSGFHCTHHYYTPALPNVPVLSQAGDCMVSAGVAIQEQATGGAVQASYSPLNHWFLSGDFMWSKPSQATSFYSTETISGKANQYSVGAGWYYTFLNDGQETSGRTNLGFSMVVFPTRKQ